MKLILNRESALEAASYVSSCVPSRSTIPILQNLLLRFGGGGASLSATNMEQSATAHVEVVMDGSDLDEGVILLDSDRFLDILRNNKESTVEIVVKDETIKVVFGKSKYAFGYQTADDFPTDLGPVFDPTREGCPVLSLSAESLARQIQDVKYAASKCGTKFVLTGVLFDNGRGILNLVATDTKQIAVSKAKSEGSEFSFLLPSKACDSLLIAAKKASDAGFYAYCQLNINHSQASFYLGKYSLSSRLPETGKSFPKWKEYLVKVGVYESEFQADELLSAVKRATPTSSSQVITNDEKGKPQSDLKWQSQHVRLMFGENLKLQSGEPMSGNEAESEIEAAPCDEGWEMKVDSSLLRPALQTNAGEKVKLVLAPGMKAMQIERGKDFCYLLIPFA